MLRCAALRSVIVRVMTSSTDVAIGSEEGVTVIRETERMPYRGDTLVLFAIGV